MLSSTNTCTSTDSTCTGSTNVNNNQLLSNHLHSGPTSNNQPSNDYWPFSSSALSANGANNSNLQFQVPFFPAINSNSLQQEGKSKPTTEIGTHSVPNSSSQSLNSQTSSDGSLGLPVSVPNVNCKITGMITVTNEIKCPGPSAPPMLPPPAVPVPPPNPDYYYTACALGAAGLSTMAVLTGGGVTYMLHVTYTNYMLQKLIDE